MDIGIGKGKTYEVKRPKQPVHWEVEVPGSKSITNRALLMAALGVGSVKLEGALFSDDIWFLIEALRQLGIFVEAAEGRQRIRVDGCGGKIPHQSAELNVGNSGTVARFLTAVLGGSDGNYTINADLQMQGRPMQSLFEALFVLGAQVTWLGEEWHLPVKLSGAAKNSTESRTETELDISESTQFLSGLLIAAPMFPEGFRLRVISDKKEGPYSHMTCRMMEDFGVTVHYEDGVYTLPAGGSYKCEEYRVEPDVSAACYFYAAAAITGGYARVNGIHTNSMQGDLQFLNVLKRMGCKVEEEQEGISVTGPAKGGLHGITVDMRDFSDQVLTLAAIAPYADGPVKITNIAHVRKQESDRINAVVTNLRRAGIRCEEQPDAICIEPGQPGPCHIETFEDHRVAMAFAVMGLAADGIVIENPNCCKKTFPQFFRVLDTLIKGEEEKKQ